MKLVQAAAEAAAETWRRLKGPKKLPLVIVSVIVIDGVAKSATETCIA